MLGSSADEHHHRQETAEFSAAWPRRLRADLRATPEEVVFGLLLAAGPGNTWYEANAAGTLRSRYLCRMLGIETEDVDRLLDRLIELGHVRRHGRNQHGDLKITLVRAEYDNADIYNEKSAAGAERGNGAEEQ